MKTFKISTLLVALASVFAFSSCLNDTDDSGSATYSTYVTIAGDSFFGYTFYADNGCILIPTLQSVSEVLPGLSGSSVKRAVVSFDLLDESKNGDILESGKTYQIVLKSSYYNYAIPTYNTLDITDNAMAADTLTTNNKQIYDINQNIWAANGYVNAQMTINYDQNKNFYLHTYYDRDKDINVETNTLYLNIYYNHNADYPTSQGSSVFSFDLPDDAAYAFKGDSVDVVLRSLTMLDFHMTQVGKCRMSVNDFRVPEF